jgi:hypothetical protein
MPRCPPNVPGTRGILPVLIALSFALQPPGATVGGRGGARLS